ncbi:MAG: hypothetical protein ACLPX9_07910, partial [Rhodomicrobium sp.]
MRLFGHEIMRGQDNKHDDKINIIPERNEPDSLPVIPAGWDSNRETAIIRIEHLSKVFASKTKTVTAVN